MKKFNETYLYRKMPDYEKDIQVLILKGERIDKSNKSFEDIKYAVKMKNVDSTLAKLLDSDRIVLVIPVKPLPKSFRVITAKDIRNDRKLKVFIDCSGIINSANTSSANITINQNNIGGYKFANNSSAVNIFISYLIAARTSFIIEAKPTLLTMNSTLTQAGTKTFAAMINYVVDYIGKININIATRNKSLYLASIYYQVNILGKDIDSKSVQDIAIKISGISEREANIIELDFEKDSFDDIEKFVNLMQIVLHVKGLTIDSFIEKWMFVYGPSTIFSLELFTYFAQTISDAYIGAYINNQKTIEKVTKQNMVEFSKTLIRIGADS